MSNSTSHDVLPRTVDPRKLIQMGVEVSGKLALKELPRLVSLLASDKGEVFAKLSFDVSEEGKKTLTGDISTAVEVICQRCLEPVSQAIVARLELALVWSEEEAVALPKYLDPWVHGEGAADLYEIIEEELLLELPMVSYHTTECVSAERFVSVDGADSEIAQSESHSDNPFKVLEQLKGSPNTRT